MSDYPVIFSAPMVRALLDGRKTMTRRLAWREGKPRDAAGLKPLTPFNVKSSWQKVQPGDRLWVRENIGRKIATSLFGTPVTNGVEEAFYAADEEEVLNEQEFNLCPWWKSAGTLPCIHMPRSVSRLTLVVTATKIEKIQSINGIDAEAEGITRVEGEAPWRTFKHLWESLHGFECWDSNPDVVALTFIVHKANIDQMRVAA